MSDWALLESVEGLGESPSAQSGALWELLQAEKERACCEISAAGSLVHSNGFAENERDPADGYVELIGWQHRNQLERRLRDIIDAQDRLTEGLYGRCVDCGGQISAKRLQANPAAKLCISCQQSAEPELAFHSI